MKDHSSTTSRINIGRLVAQFIRFYGNDTFQDGRMGWKFFWLLADEMKSAIAMERIHLITGTSVGMGSVMGDAQEAKRLLQQSIKEATVLD